LTPRGKAFGFKCQEKRRTAGAEFPTMMIQKDFCGPFQKFVWFKGGLGLETASARCWISCAKVGDQRNPMSLFLPSKFQNISMPRRC
jgi:hypothetical protein